MTLDTCVAHAIHKDLDIIEAIPEITDVPVEELERYCESFVGQVHDAMTKAISDLGPKEKTMTTEELALFLFEELPVALPLKMLQKMCETYKTLRLFDAKFILDFDDGPFHGGSLYSVNMKLNFGREEVVDRTPNTSQKVPDIFNSIAFA